MGLIPGVIFVLFSWFVPASPSHAEFLCAPNSKCERENAERVAAGALNVRLRPCKNVYPELDVARAAAERLPIDPDKAQSCILEQLAGASIFFIAEVDPTTKIITLREQYDALEALRGTMDFEEAIRRDRKAAIDSFLSDQLARFRKKSVQSQVVSPVCPSGQSGTPPNCASPTPIVSRQPQGSPAPEAGPGSPQNIVRRYQAAVNIVMNVGLVPDGDYGHFTLLEVRGFQRWFNSEMIRQHVVQAGQQALALTGRIDSKTAEALIWAFQKKTNGLSATGLLDDATIHALDEAAARVQKGRARYSAAGYFSADANGSRRADYLAVERRFGNRRPEITGLCYGHYRDCSVNADVVPGAVPSRADRHSVPAGTLGVAYNLKTGQTVKVVAYDTGSPMRYTGELNPAALSSIGGNPDPKRGGLAQGQIKWCLGTKKPGGYRDEADLLEWLDRFEGC